MPQSRPNILYIMSDDHSTNAINCYGGWLNEVVDTPNLDRIAREGMRFEHCYCNNSLCSPSRASIITGQYSHKNGVTRHYGLRTKRYKMAVHRTGERDLFDLDQDPLEMKSEVHNPNDADVLAEMERELEALVEEVGISDAELPTTEYSTS